MNWRTMFLSVLLATGLTLSMVPRASADPPPWAGRWQHNHERQDRDRGDRWSNYNNHRNNYRNNYSNNYRWRDRNDGYAWRHRWNDHDQDDGYTRRSRPWYGPRYGWNDRYYRSYRYDR